WPRHWSSDVCSSDLAFCREKGILFVVDGIQGLGALPIDVEEAGIDVLAADSHKWLLGTESSTVFYVAEGARERVPPIAAGWWNRSEERRVGKEGRQR